MKTLKAIIGACALLFVVGACSNPPSGKSLDDYEKLSQGDSLSYLYGMTYADNYWRMAESDSAALSEAGRKQYLEGIQKGLAMASANEQYNSGLLMGLQMVMAKKDLKKQLGVSIEPELFISGLAYGLKADTVASNPRYQRAFQQIVDAIGKKKDKEDANIAGRELLSMAENEGFTSMGENVYGKVVVAGEGPLLQEGQTVNVDIKLQTLSGKELPIPMPDQIKVGSEFENPIGQAILKMHVKEKVELLTTAVALFGHNCSRLGIDTTEVLKMTIETKGE